MPVITAAGGALTIDGAGQSVTISGNDTVRLFSVGTGATLNLQNLTLANGRALTGGGVRNAGTLHVSNCIFASNVSTTTVMGLGGGAIYNDNNAALTVSRSVFSDNQAVMAGGGIYVRAGGAITITNSTFTRNSASGGGGISNAGTMLVTGSTFSGNRATVDGGGIGNGGALTVTNCTFSGNSAGTIGGGITNGGTLTVINSTFSGNSATTSGGGIRNSGTATVYNTILADSTAGGNCSGTITNGGNNLDDGTTCGWGANNGSMSNTNPQLGPLADNGGPTWTFALLAGSPAIDGVTYNSPNNCPAIDQRGYKRPLDGDGNGSELCDIGAFEYQRYFIYLPFILKEP